MAADRLAPADQARLAAEAKAGLAAMDLLAEEVRQITHKKARGYADKFGVPADDLAQVGFLRLRPAVKSYSPAHGSFLNYYMSAAMRAMKHHGMKHGSAVARSDSEAVEFAASDAGVGREERPDAEVVVAALAALKPLAREVLTRLHGYGGPKCGADALADEMGVSTARILDIHDDAVIKMRAVIDQSPGRAG